MSHSHSHAPGEEHSHSHSHSPPQTPQSPGIPAPDPAMQALIDAEFQPTALTLSDDRNKALCEEHRLEKCNACDIDFVNLNRLAALLVHNPNLLCPPPSNVITQQITQVVTSTKDEGNALFKSGLHTAAINRYTGAASVAISRPPWEANQFMREELSTVISNRSAAYYEAHDYIAALADAEAVIQVRRNWSKGHFRKAKALLGLNRLGEAADAVKVGLAFEPANTELSSFLAEIEKFEKRHQDAKIEARLLEKSEKDQQQAVTA
ncbi:Hsp70-Hsp90 organizing protein 3 [Hypsizygus marmoreus]|uniref:Hsp70-Hsp90 organizing protein 3 n=1 Tax=Hypsizygus marmoreus TaxID=39966 RepID=A0A369JQ61_HYPMA|nr:Hsp70-Hsp90 organizing protein 3 [Hypsizygus marmoreus]